MDSHQFWGKGLDKYLSGPQKQMLSEFFERATQATEEETERFLMTVRRGKRVR